MHDSGFKLTDLLSSAGSTIGIIISGTIFLQFMSTKYIELIGRYRELTCEYRGRKAGEVRHSLLQSQIRVLRRRLSLMNRASQLAAVALMSLIVAEMAGGISVLFPPVRAMKAVGTAGLFIGLVLICCAVALELTESLMSRNELGEEVGDLDDSAREEIAPIISSAWETIVGRANRDDDA
jgi:hypothetical protein